jgi:hypothetical protein
MKSRHVLLDFLVIKVVRIQFCKIFYLLRFFRCLELSPNDPKALFRRCQAYEAVDKVDAAYKDGRECHRVDPNNPALQPILIRLHKAVSEKVNIKYCFKLTS